MSSFASRLRAAREARGFSQEDLAKLASISSDTISRLERGLDSSAKPLHSLVELARALEVSTDHLLGLDGDASTAPPEEPAPDMRRLLRAARQLGVRELNLVAQLADALLAKQPEPRTQNPEP